MAITGAHMLFYTSEADQLRAMLRDVFGFPSVDAGGGWLIFELPVSEIGVHPDEGPTYEAGTRHQITFMCDDIKKTIAELRAKGVTVDRDAKDEGYGITTMMHLPGGCEVMLYEPRHAIAAGMTTKKAAMSKPAKPAARKAAKKSRAKAAKKTLSPRRGRRAKPAPRRG
jgi:catechol 2,3-dioxygenase-like lactoylglutathione lyase family enzyme